jgi:hypothetical protein
VRAFDILGAEQRLREYEILWYIKLKEIENNKKTIRKKDYMERGCQ